MDALERTQPAARSTGWTRTRSRRRDALAMAAAGRRRRRTTTACDGTGNHVPSCVFALRAVCVLSLCCGLACGQLRYAVTEEVESGALVGDLLQDLGHLDVRKLAARKLRATSAGGKRYVVVDPKTGKLFVNERIDRETLATDGGSPPLSSQKTIQVDVADVNDNPPRFQQTSYTVYMVENNAPGAPLCTVRALDDDIKDNARITYTVLNDNNHGIPVTSYVSVKADTGEAYALRAFDYETLREFHFQVKAQDGGIPPLSRVATVYIYVMDQNDHAPQIVSPRPNATRPIQTVLKNAEPGTLVTKVVAYDADAGPNAWLVYMLEQATDMDLFKVHEHTGEVRTTRRVLEDNSTSFSLTVLVRDHGQPVLSSTATINVAVMEGPQKQTPDPKRIIRPHSTLLFSNVTLYLIVALSATTFVFLVTVVVLAIVRCHAYCTQPGSCSPCCVSQKAPPDGGNNSVSGGGGGAGGGGGGGGPGGPQPNNNVVLRRDLKVEPHYIEVRGNGSMTKTYCYKTCLTATSGSDTFMFYNTGRPISGTWGSGAERFFTSNSGFVRRLSMPGDNSLQICPECSSSPPPPLS
ncbi:hypothetical protein CRUP_036058 [Coryphaenoides rupestris]|nr:hypothetical protein CRUP_036058 [Coryphaenoides rupestris]